MSGRKPWYADHVAQLRNAAQATDSKDEREWFTKAADDLEAERPVICLDEIMLYAGRVLAPVSHQ